MATGSDNMGSQIEDPVDKRTRLRARMLELVTDTSMHGLPRVYTAVPLLKKAVWLCFVLLGFGKQSFYKLIK